MSALGLLTLAGCNVLSSNKVAGSEGRVVTLADGRKVVVSGQKQADGTIVLDSASKTTDETSSSSTASTVTSSSSKKALTPPKNTKAKKESKQKKSKKNKAVAAVTSDRQVVETATPVKSVATIPAVQDTVTAAEASEKDKETLIAEQNNFSINGEWTIYSVRGNLVTGEERPYVTFDIPASRFYGNNGCNYINGDLTIEANRRVKLENMISTMKMCADDQFQYLINLSLNDIASYVVREESPITFLDMKDESGRVVLVLRRHNMDFLNGAWRVTELHATPLEQEDEATMTFDTTDLKIHGTTGCNIFNGELFIDPDKTNSLQILKLITTRMACPNDSRETEFLLGLEDVETAIRVNDGEVVLYNPDGTPVFKLIKIDLSDDAE